MEIQHSQQITIAKSSEEVKAEALLAKEQEKREQIERDTNARIEQNIALTEQKRQFNFEAEFARRLKVSGIEFLGESKEVHQILAHRYTFTIADTGEFKVQGKTGVDLDFQELLEKEAVARPYLVNPDSINHLRVPVDELTRESFKTDNAKRVFIERYGLAAWEQLPIRALSKYEIDERRLTARDWMNLSEEQKSHLCGKYGSQFVAMVMARR
jgi:hypothetical protein